MEFVTIGLIVLNIFLVAFLLLRNRGNGDVEHQVLKTIVDYQDRQKHYQSQEFQNLRETMEKRLGDGLDKSRETLSQVLERLVKVDSAQRQISTLSENVVMLQNVLTDKKTRGIFGEVQLKQILVNVFGESMDHVFQLQATMTNGKIADAILKMPEPLGIVAVDAKFPLENYRRMVDGTSDDVTRQGAAKEFSKNLKKHIDDISSKYIIANETSDQAILFLPAEAIFSEVHAHHGEIVEYAASKKVWLTSPTTLMAILSTVQAVLINIERNSHIDEIHEEINKLGVDFERYEERWDDLVKHLGTIQKDVDRLNISNKKLSERFKKIIRL